MKVAKLFLRDARSRLPGARGWSLALLSVATAVGWAAEGKLQATSTYSGGTCLLSAVAVKQEQWPTGPDRWTVQLQFQTEFPSPKPGVGPRMLPENVYVNDQRSPLIAAYAPGGKKNLATRPHAGSATASGFVLIANLHLGQPYERLERVEIEVELVRIVEWETQMFEIGMGPSNFMQCGPFEMRATGSAKVVQIDTDAYPQFARDHAAYRRKMPLSFVTHDLGVTWLKITDAAGRIPLGQAQMIKTRTNWKIGLISTEYRSWFSENSPPIQEEIVYPVSVFLKLPRRYETERVRFHFAEIPLPQPPT